MLISKLTIIFKIHTCRLQLQINIINMNEEDDQNKTLTSVQGKILINQDQIEIKRNLIQQFIAYEHRRQEIIMEWPNQKVQQIVKSQQLQSAEITIHKSINTLYFGQTCNEMYHGYGIIVYLAIQSNGQSIIRFYEGNFQNNCKHGYGLEYINGDVYIGHFLNNKPQDSNGLFLWLNGDVYHGSFINGMKHGHGKWQSGSQLYEGNWRFNKPEGNGHIRSAISEYNGEVKNGYKHGLGSELFKNGDRYEGSYSNGKPEGQGTYEWNNGSIYKGQFKNGLRFGYGIWAYGNQKYEGSYINDKRNGEGKYIWNNNSYYQGTFVEDLRHGIGEMHWDQFSYYKGSWGEGLQHGEGEVYDRDKIVEKGIYERGKCKINHLQQSNTHKLAPLKHHTNQTSKSRQKENSSVKNQQHKLSFFERKRINSHNNSQSKHHEHEFSQTKTHKIPSLAANYHRELCKQKEDQLIKKREVNKRYSVLEKINQKKIDSDFHGSKNKRLSEFINSKNSQQKYKKHSKLLEESQKVSDGGSKDNLMLKKNIAKISMYHVPHRTKQNKEIQKRLTVNKVNNTFDNDMVMMDTQLSPIKWNNFKKIPE